MGVKVINDNSGGDDDGDNSGGDVDGDNLVLMVIIQVVVMMIKYLGVAEALDLAGLAAHQVRQRRALLVVASHHGVALKERGGC
jgi:hypothetical protein